MRNEELIKIIRPLPNKATSYNCSIGFVEEMLRMWEEDLAQLGNKVDLTPPFQRGHVWDEHQQVSFVNNYLRGLADCTVKFAISYWMNGNINSGEIKDMVCVDGLQRITAIRRFMAEEIEAFWSIKASDLKGTKWHPRTKMITVEIYEIATYKELYQFYLDLNSGGTPHTNEELDKVRRMMDTEVITNNNLNK